MNYQMPKYIYTLVILLSITAIFLYFMQNEKDECNVFSGTYSNAWGLSNHLRNCELSEKCTVKITGEGGDPLVFDSDWTEFKCITKPPLSLRPYKK